MARVSSKNPKPKTEKREEPEANALKRKRVEAVNNLVRARDGSAFTRCEECKKDVPVMLVDMHSCSLESKIKMKMESMVVERQVEEKKPAESRKKSGKSSTAAPPKSKASKTKKAKSSNPNAPKKPLTAFLIFMDDFRKEYKEAHPDSKGVAEVTKAGGEKWKAIPEEEKKVYLDKAAELKAEYVEAMAKLNAEPENNEEQQADEVVKNELEDDTEEEETAKPDMEEE